MQACCTCDPCCTSLTRIAAPFPMQAQQHSRQPDVLQQAKSTGPSNALHHRIGKDAA